MSDSENDFLEDDYNSDNDYSSDDSSSKKSKSKKKITKQNKQNNKSKKSELLDNVSNDIDEIEKSNLIPEPKDVEPDNDKKNKTLTKDKKSKLSNGEKTEKTETTKKSKKEEEKEEISPDDIKPVSINATDEKKTIKKKPGRPKKEIIKNSLPKLGIVNEPSNASILNSRLINVFEILYDNPIMFKKVFALFKAMSVGDIRIKLEKTFIKMYAIDHTKTNEIYIKIHSDKINRYYTSKTLEFGLNKSNIYKIMQTINKNHSKIYWFTNINDERSKIKIGVSMDDIEDETIYTVDQDQLEEYDWAIENELLLESNYSISFNLPFKYFKKKICDSKLLGQIIKIEKNGADGPLRLSYNFNKGGGDQNTYFKNSAKINLKSKVGPGEIFSTSVYLEKIKPLASTLIADNIHIATTLDKKIIFTILLDHDEKSNKEKIPDTEKCEIKVLTEIVRAN